MGPMKCAEKASLNSPLKVNAMECPKPSPGQNEMPMKSKKQNEVLCIYGLIVPNKINPLKKTNHSMCFLMIFIVSATA